MLVSRAAAASVIVAYMFSGGLAHAGNVHVDAGHIAGGGASGRVLTGSPAPGGGSSSSSSSSEQPQGGGSHPEGPKLAPHQSTPSSSSSSSEEPHESPASAPSDHPIYDVSCKIFGNSEPGFNYLNFMNTGNATLPAGTIVRVHMPDGTTVDLAMGGYVPGGDYDLVGMFPDGVPDGWTCDFELILP